MPWLIHSDIRFQVLQKIIPVIKARKRVHVKVIVKLPVFCLHIGQIGENAYEISGYVTMIL
ncbi:MAG: hypothetical protein ABC360_04835 [Acetomicrobium sp.]